MPAPNFNDSSWDPSWLSMYGWIYPARWEKADAELRNAIVTNYREALEAVGRLGKQVGEMERLLDDWREMLIDYDRTIKYWEAGDVLADLIHIRDEARHQLETDRLLIAAQKKPPLSSDEATATVSVTTTVAKPKVRKRKKKSKAKTGDVSDDEVFASTMLGFSRSTATTPPPKVQPVARPFVPPTPQQEWAWVQRKMATDCDNGIAFGTHPVNQESVLRQLALGPGAGSVLQYRSGPENSHVRIMKSDENQYWTKGLSHDEVRRTGRFMVYRRVGARSEFVHVSGIRHPQEV